MGGGVVIGLSQAMCWGVTMVGILLLVMVMFSLARVLVVFGLVVVIMLTGAVSYQVNI